MNLKKETKNKHEKVKFENFVIFTYVYTKVKREQRHANGIKLEKRTIEMCIFQYYVIPPHHISRINNKEFR